MRLAVFFSAAALLAGCSHASPSTTGDEAPVHTLALPPDLPPTLPEGPGLAEVYASCLTCHSSRYIAMQPRFPRKTWQAEVSKMQKTYGAPFPQELAPKIVDYLVATRGVE